MGFEHVFDFAPGKMSWLAAGLDKDGDRSAEPRVGDIARLDPPVCNLDDVVGDLRDRNDIDHWGFCVVTDGEGVVHGLIMRERLADSPSATEVEDIMELGPTSYRPSHGIEAARESMSDHQVEFVLVTTECGELLGVLFTSDLTT